MVRIRLRTLSAMLPLAAILLGFTAQAQTTRKPGHRIDNTKPPTKTAPPTRKSAGPLIMAGDAPHLSVMYTGDVIGYLEPCG